MQWIVSLVAMLTLFGHISLYAASIDKEVEEKKISRLVTHFFNACRSKKFAQANELTTGKEQEIFSSILKQIKRRNGSVPTELERYMSRLYKFRVDIVEVANSGEKAIALCTLQFKFYDSQSKDQIFKEREVHYYIEKAAGKWKIAHSKLKKETYYYKNKSHPRRMKRY